MAGPESEEWSDDALAAHFVSSVPPEQRERIARPCDLGPRLAALVASARGSWPRVQLPADAFVRHLAERIGHDDHEAVLGAIHAADLYLACACAAGDRRALAEFDRAFLSEVERYVGKLGGMTGFADEVRQLLREKLFIPTQGRPKILDYTGRGPLGAWLRVAAIRTARNLQRSAKSSIPVVRGVDDRIRAKKPDPELNYLQRWYSAEFREAFEQTLTALAPRERNILRLHFLEGMSSSAIAAMYQVSGATIRLWMKQWREAILAETRRRLATRLRMDTREFDGAMELIQSQFDLTVSRLLR